MTDTPPPIFSDEPPTDAQLEQAPILYNAFASLHSQTIDRLTAVEDKAKFLCGVIGFFIPLSLNLFAIEGTPIVAWEYAVFSLVLATATISLFSALYVTSAKYFKDLRIDFLRASATNTQYTAQQLAFYVNKWLFESTEAASKKIEKLGVWLRFSYVTFACSFLLFICLAFIHLGIIAIR